MEKSKQPKAPSLNDMMRKAQTKKKKDEVTVNNLPQILADKGISQAELADLTSKPATYISRVVNGKKKCISLPMALRIAKAIGVPVEKIWDL